MICFKKWFRKEQKVTVNEGLNVVTGISKAKSLYKELIVLAHPDRHPNEEDFYQELSNRITANRYNYNELEKIKQELLSVGQNLRPLPHNND